MSIKHTFRYAEGEREEEITPIRAIRHFCRECYGFCTNIHLEIAECPSRLCALWPFRQGDSHTYGAMERAEMARRSKERWDKHGGYVTKVSS